VRTLTAAETVAIERSLEIMAGCADPPPDPVIARQQALARARRAAARYAREISGLTPAELATIIPPLTGKHRF
jgi:hypothetical protein